MIKVLKRGKPPIAMERRFQASCYKCDSVLEFTAAEAKVFPEYRDDAWSVICPVCEYRVFAYLRDEVVTNA
jgi:hypothetical protein